MHREEEEAVSAGVCTFSGLVWAQTEKESAVKKSPQAKIRRL